MTVIDEMTATLDQLWSLMGRLPRRSLRMHPDTIAEFAARFPAPPPLKIGPTFLSVSLRGIAVYADESVPVGSYKWSDE